MLLDWWGTSTVCCSAISYFLDGLASRLEARASAVPWVSDNKLSYPSRSGVVDNLKFASNLEFQDEGIEALDIKQEDWYRLETRQERNPNVKTPT